MPKKEKTERQIDEILELLPWPKELRAGEPYVRLHDDHDGTYEGELMVYITPDGDAWGEHRRTPGSYVAVQDFCRGRQ